MRRQEMLSSSPSFQDIVAALMALASVAVVAYLAVVGSEAMAGVLGGVVAAAVGFYLRGKVERPTGEPPADRGVRW
jgi:hypothetical protein